MSNRCWRVCWLAISLAVPVSSQRQQEQGTSIGSITTQGNLVVMELKENALGKANLFDLDHKTIRFTPEGDRYRAETIALKWDPAFGSELTESTASLHNFAFPFSGRSWNSFSVATTGNITFGEGTNTRGFPIGRFDPLTEASTAIINTMPGISVFLKPRMSGHRYFKEQAGRAVVTWDLTEPWGNIQDFTWKPTVNRFQAVLERDGTIELSYNEVTARDAIVGLYPLAKAGVEKPLASLAAQPSSAAPHLNITTLKLAAVDGLFLRVTFETTGPLLAEGDPALNGVAYRIHLSTSDLGTGTKNNDNCVLWTIRGVGRRTGGSRYVSFGPGLSHVFTASGNAIVVQGSLPTSFKNATRLFVSAEALAAESSPAVASQVTTSAVELSGIRSPEVDLSALKKQDGPFKVVFETFHYLALPNPRDLACSVIGKLGDHFDMLAYYSDFRIDNQEAGTPSNGPMGGNVTGIGQTQRGLESYCSAGRFQWGFVQPVYVGSNQMQERPPGGTHTGNSRDVDFYDHQLGERSPDARMTSYNYAMSQIGHEMGHRWSAFVSAKVNGELIELGPTHWARGLQAPVAFPYQRPTEASAMGGGYWQDNFDGTYTQLDDDYYVPATGYSFLDLYLMGLIAPSEVPSFFILKNLLPAGTDSNGHPIFKADRVKVTVDDVVAVEGPRTPSVDQSQKKFNTGMVVIVEHGKKPSPRLIERTKAIGERWSDYWTTVTGHRSSMTTSTN